MRNGHRLARIERMAATGAITASPVPVQRCHCIVASPANQSPVCIHPNSAATTAPAAPPQAMTETAFVNLVDGRKDDKNSARAAASRSAIGKCTVAGWRLVQIEPGSASCSSASRTGVSSAARAFGAVDDSVLEADIDAASVGASPCRFSP